MSCPAPERSCCRPRTQQCPPQASSPQKCLQPPEVVQAVSRALVAACCHLFPFCIEPAVSHPSHSTDSPTQLCPILPQPSEDSETVISPQPKPGSRDLTPDAGGGQLEDEAQGPFSKAQRSPVPAASSARSCHAQPSVHTAAATRYRA